MVPLPIPALPTENWIAANICLKVKAVGTTVFPGTLVLVAVIISIWFVTLSGVVYEKAGVDPAKLWGMRLKILAG